MHQNDIRMAPEWRWRAAPKPRYPQSAMRRAEEVCISAGRGQDFVAGALSRWLGKPNDLCTARVMFSQRIANPPQNLPPLGSSPSVFKTSRGRPFFFFKNKKTFPRARSARAKRCWACVPKGNQALGPAEYIGGCGVLRQALGPSEYLGGSGVSAKSTG